MDSRIHEKLIEVAIWCAAFVGISLLIAKLHEEQNLGSGDPLWRVKAKANALAQRNEDEERFSSALKHLMFEAYCALEDPSANE